MYLTPSHQKIAADWLNGPLWAEIKRCLMARRPESPEPKDDSHVAAAKGHQRVGFEKAIQEIEKLPLESESSETSVFERPAVTITED